MGQPETGKQLVPDGLKLSAITQLRSFSSCADKGRTGPEIIGGICAIFETSRALRISQSCGLTATS